MFTIEFAEGVCLGYRRATAKAPTVRRALDFAAEFAPGRCGVIASAWDERDGRMVMDVYDWCDCWFSGPLPVLARIVAPPAATTANLPGPLRLHTARNRNAAPVKLSDWLAAAFAMALSAEGGFVLFDPRSDIVIDPSEESFA